MNKYVKAKLIKVRVIHLAMGGVAPLFDLADYPEIGALAHNQIIAIAEKQLQLGLLDSYLTYEFCR